MNDELVTIIVPVYNMIDYIERCVLSIIEQTYTNIQIILVDDGSTDGSGELCDAFAKRDSRIEVIHQMSEGVSAARNSGLDRMRGGWISFVDSDDYTSPYYIEDMLLAAKEGCDIAVCLDITVSDSTKDLSAPFRRFSKTQRITGYMASVQHFSTEAYILNSSCGKLFRARLWENLRFPNGKINEDLFVSHALLYNAEYVIITDAVLYAYVQTTNSIMRSPFALRRLDILDAWEEGVRVFSAAGEPELTHIAHRVFVSRIFDAICICKREIPHEREAIKMLRLRAAEAYRNAKPVSGYLDCSKTKALAYRIKLMLGRWFLPIYNFLFIRGRRYI